MAAALFIIGIAGSAQADDATQQDHEPRIALVIGNSNYPTKALVNPVNDAHAMADVLRRVGFKVQTRENATQREMKRAIRDFGNELSAVRGVGLFYYAGHGIQLNNENFLIPVDADIAKPADVAIETVGLQELLGQMKEARTRLNIIILDACRNDPFSRRFRGQANQGLAFVAAPTGTFIAYATAPGDVAGDGNGRNGLYTSALINAIGLPGLSIEDVFKKVRTNVERASNDAQTPWENTSLTGDFYFVPPLPPAPLPPPPPPVDRDAMFWQSATKSNTIAGYREYLTAFPTGTFAGLARAQISELEARAAPKPEPSLPRGPATGVLRLHVRPAGATVRIDGAEYGDGPDLVARLTAGHHTVVVSKAGVGDARREITITDGSSADLGVELEDQRPKPRLPDASPAVPATGLLRLHVRPADATVRIDGAEYGDGPDLVAKLTAGRHTIVVSKAGADNVRREIMITEGSSAEIGMALVERPVAQPPVVQAAVLPAVQTTVQAPVQAPQQLPVATSDHLRNVFPPP